MLARLSLAAAAVALMTSPVFAQDPPATQPDQPPAAEQAPTPAPVPVAPSPDDAAKPGPGDTAAPAPDATPSEATPPVAAEAPAPAPGLVISELKEVQDGDRQVAAWGIKVDQADDLDIYGPDGKKIAEVEEVLEDSKGEMKAVVAEFGGFLGIGSTEVIISLDQLQHSSDRLTTSLTQEQLSGLPEWKK